MHVYISALPFCPSNVLLSKMLMPKFHCLAVVFAGGFKEWPGVQLILEGHENYVTSVAFSPDGKRIVSGSSDKTVRVWDAERGVQVGSPLEGHTGQVTSVAFSPDGKRIASGSSDKTLRVWDAESYEEMICNQDTFEPPANNPKSACPLPSPANTYSICFSSMSFHALHDAGQLLDGLQDEHASVRDDPVTLYSDGWLKGPNGRLLLWIPASLRVPFYSLWTTAVIPNGGCVELDLSQMVHGTKWHQCFKSAEI
ncbi:hypothetical protein M404DRAFT_922554 [Pisolithus tinctorius Marx 270]|uniref:Uncharacterized protein n=1 Tax=Pisolithus tinctorius Marx 270 TaxID=870435 RepID=A0A0C3JH26_PISTI|nr:hypothetical protein M404DRAFT_922554 [Pisolithus tinctorius Marx 270]